ncbi:hypothetical protein VP1G_02031 [Cytospora mali]|uniref:Luciferase domain-containing protein n=1 Tax=Cytospora mali TaxID=578113 RepID=A0A194USL0_CYTMA|nr:hypothetical protein VP1G_02031 [Valsa mali var. pyri (nom. inval.)]
MATNTFSSLAAHLRAHTIPAPQSLHQNPKLATAIALTATITLIPALNRAARSYRGFLALGPGGIPHNILGWSIQGILQLVAKWDTRSTAPFSDPKNRTPYEPHGTRTYLDAGAGPGPGNVPDRRGERPEVPGYVAPQRQTTQQGGAQVRARMVAFLEDVAARNPGVLAVRPSGLEGVGTPALWLDVEGGRGVTVPGLADAEELVRKGWAERHRLSGVWKVLPWGYVIVYAPRDEGEFEVWKGVVRAGVRFVCAGSGKEVVVD